MKIENNTKIIAGYWMMWAFSSASGNFFWDGHYLISFIYLVICIWFTLFWLKWLSNKNDEVKDLKEKLAETEETLGSTEKECKEIEWYFDKFVDYLWTKKANQILNWKKWKS